MSMSARKVAGLISGSFAVFSVPTRTHAKYYAKEIPIFISRYVLRRKDTKRQAPLYQYQNLEVTNTTRSYVPRDEKA